MSFSGISNTFRKNAAVYLDTIEDWKQRILILIEKYDENDVFNCDEIERFLNYILTSRLFWKKKNAKEENN